jgi:hypothetical protein
VEGGFYLTEQKLTLQFSITPALFSPPANTSLTVGHKLWEQNCVEFFWYPDKNSTEYFELNLSFDNRWNIYHFSDYRQEMRDVTKDFLATVHYTEHFNQNRITLSVSPIEKISSFQLATIIYNPDANYFSLEHAPQPDFHHPDYFRIRSNRTENKSSPP